MSAISLSSDPRQGFTIVELGVVIVVIGILATLAVFSFGAWRTSVAHDEVKNDLNGVQAAMESARHWDTGFPEIADGSPLPDTIFESSDSVSLTYYEGDSDGYCIEGQSLSKTDVKYHLDIRTGETDIVEGEC